MEKTIGVERLMWVSSSSQLRVSQGSTCVLSTLMVLDITQSLKVQDVLSLLSRSLTCTQSLNVQDVFSLLSWFLTCTQSLKVQDVFSLYSLPQGSPCALTALRVPQSLSPCLAERFQITWCSVSKLLPWQMKSIHLTCYVWWYIFFTENSEQLLKLWNPPSLSAMYWSQNSNDHSQESTATLSSCL